MIRSTMSAGDSATTYLVPSISEMTVSPVVSTRSIRSALMPNRDPFSRVNKITTAPPCVFVETSLMPVTGQSVPPSCP